MYCIFNYICTLLHRWLTICLFYIVNSNKFFMDFVLPTSLHDHFFRTFALRFLSRPLFVRATAAVCRADDHVTEVTLVTHDGVVWNCNEDGFAVRWVFGNIALHSWKENWWLSVELMSRRKTHIVQHSWQLLMWKNMQYKLDNDAHWSYASDPHLAICVVNYQQHITCWNKIMTSTWMENKLFTFSLSCMRSFIVQSTLGIIPWSVEPRPQDTQDTQDTGYC